MHLSIPEQSYPRTPVYVDTKTQEGEPLMFQAHLTHRVENRCVVQAHDEQWYCVPVEQVFPLQ